MVRCLVENIWVYISILGKIILKIKITNKKRTLFVQMFPKIKEIDLKIDKQTKSVSNVRRLNIPHTLS